MKDQYYIITMILKSYYLVCFKIEYNFGEKNGSIGNCYEKKFLIWKKDGQVDDIPQYVENFINDFNDEKNEEIYNKLFEK